MSHFQVYGIVCLKETLKIQNNEVSNFYFDPVILHLAGIRRRDRLKFIREYKHCYIIHKD